MRDLVGQGKPFHSAIDKAAGLLKRKVGTGAEFLKEMMSLPGVKQAEITDRKLGELLGLPKMTHEQFMGELAARPMPAIGEKVLGEKPSKQAVIKEANAINDAPVVVDFSVFRDAMVWPMVVSPFAEMVPT